MSLSRVALAVAFGLLLSASAHAGRQDKGGKGNDKDNNGKKKARSPFVIGLWGDLPYSPEQASVGMPNLIADMNANKLAFTVMTGDLKAGGTRCDDSVYAEAKGFFDALKAPAAFTPGDNDWVDCDRASAGAYNSLERLDFERAFFFNTSYTMGQKKLRQEVQAEPLCPGFGGTSVRCVENRRWMYNGVMFMTANVQGSCNNLCDTAPDAAEWAGRDAANIAWLRDTFAQAKAQGAAAVMIVSQATPGWDDSDPTRAPVRDAKTLKLIQPANASLPRLEDGFEAWLLAVRAEAVAYGKPVAYVHGDSHYFRVDRPLLDRNGKRIATFTRVETPGDNAPTGNDDVTWVKVLVDPKSREVFSFVPMTVPANSGPYTARRRDLRA